MFIVESAGRKKYDDNDDEYYTKDMAMKITRYTNIITFIWLAFFFAGCQDMVIAGAVSRWFFTAGDKMQVLRPIGRSWQTLFGFHIGTVFFGSLILTIVRLIRMAVQMLIVREVQQFVLCRFYHLISLSVSALEHTGLYP